jgi:hypothetical protein
MMCYEWDGAKPDLLVLGKALSGGTLPVSAVLGNDEVRSGGGAAQRSAAQRVLALGKVLGTTSEPSPALVAHPGPSSSALGSEPSPALMAHPGPSSSALGSGPSPALVAHPGPSSSALDSERPLAAPAPPPWPPAAASPAHARAPTHPCPPAHLPPGDADDRPRPARVDVRRQPGGRARGGGLAARAPGGGAGGERCSPGAAVQGGARGAGQPAHQAGEREWGRSLFGWVGGGCGMGC